MSLHTIYTDIKSVYIYIYIYIHRILIIGIILLLFTIFYVSCFPGDISHVSVSFFKFFKFFKKVRSSTVSRKFPCGALLPKAGAETSAIYLYPMYPDLYRRYNNTLFVS